MKSKTIGAIALSGALAIVGCVSVDSLQTQMKSGDAGQVADAKAKITEIITVGKSGLSTFNASKRKQCAEMVSDSDHALEIIKKMAKPEAMYINPQSTPNEVIEAHDGLSNSANHPIFQVLLSKIDMSNKSVNNEILPLILDNCGRDGNFDQVVTQIVHGMNDKEALLNLQAQCCDYRSYKNYEPRMKLYDNHVVVDRLIELSPSQQLLADLIDRDLNWAGSGKSAGLGIKEYVLEKMTDNKLLLTLAAKVKNDRRFQKKIYDRVTDEKELLNFAINVEDDNWQATMSEAGANAVKKINDPAALVKISLLAKNSYIAGEAKEKISADDFIKGFVALLKEGKLTEKKAISIVNGLKDNQGTIEMYDAAKAEAVKGSVFAKLKTSDRASIRARNKGECEKKIAAAKAKGKDTFELGGFYLGMDIADVDMLIGYYFPEWSNNQDFEDDEKEVRAIWVPNQKTAFCRAGKDGKVYELNFGKTILKKWYKYDVQRFTDWADKYAAENKIEMPAILVKRDVTVQEPMSPSSYEIWYRQQSHQYKNNVKGYRLTYFTEDANYFSGHGGVAGNVLKGLAADRVRYIRGDAGMLKVRIERD